MSLDEMRERNEEQAERQAASGPVRDAPDAAPIADAIEDFYRRDDLAFGIPAHRGGTAEVDATDGPWPGPRAYLGDLGMNNGVDNRHQSWQVEPTAMELFARAVGADTTLFSTNGSTENVHVAMMTVAAPGETIVMARNGHKSAFSGLVISGVRPVYVDPVYDRGYEVAHGVEPEELDRVLSAHPEARAAMIFTPSYYGVSADVSALAEVAHSHDVPLVSDDAWGLDYAFCSRLPRSAIECGADLAIGSVHKSLSGLGQTSVLSVKGNRIDPERLSLVFELEQSTSASSLLLASIDVARRRFARDGERLLGETIDRALWLREQIAAIPGLGIMGEDCLGPGATALDPTHVCVEVRGLGLTGYQAADRLLADSGIHVELADHRRIMLLLSYADREGNLTRVLEALRSLAQRHAGGSPAEAQSLPAGAELRTETVMLPREAFLGVTEMVGWRDAPGRVSAEMICPYPPGIPILAPGERITGEIVDFLQHVVAAGAMVEGAADESLARMRVVAS